MYVCTPCTYTQTHIHTHTCTCSLTHTYAHTHTHSEPLDWRSSLASSCWYWPPSASSLDRMAWRCVRRWNHPTTNSLRRSATVITHSVTFHSPVPSLYCVCNVCFQHLYGIAGLHACTGTIIIFCMCLHDRMSDHAESCCPDMFWHSLAKASYPGFSLALRAESLGTSSLVLRPLLAQWKVWGRD